MNSSTHSPARLALGHPDFSRYAFARFAATLAWQMIDVVLGFQMWELTKNPLYLGYIGLAQFLPFVALLLPGGQIADRFDRRLIIALAYGLELLACAVLFGGVMVLLPAFADRILHVDSVGLGFLRAAPGVGAALVALWLGIRPIQRHAGTWMFGGVAVFGLCMVIFGFSTSFWLSLAVLAISGAADMVSVFVRGLLVQLETPDAIRGRVSAVNSMFIGASNELGAFRAGVSASVNGMVNAVLWGGVMTLLVVGSYLKLFPQLRKLDRFPDATH